MIQGKKGPIILLLTLGVLAFFIAGMQYGKSVERANEKIQYVLSITPEPISSPTSLPSISYETYTSTECGIKFLYPSTFSISKEASTEAIIAETTTNQSILINCAEDPIPTPQVASDPAELDNSTGLAYENPETNTIHYRVRNQQGELITAEVSKEIAPLFITSFEFTN